MAAPLRWTPSRRGRPLVMARWLPRSACPCPCLCPCPSPCPFERRERWAKWWLRGLGDAGR
eukprot:1070261-Pyramimonas_sp.AAC.1